jgi:prepilin-type N-terminal cleavage/methylation domain-containing protein
VDEAGFTLIELVIVMIIIPIIIGGVTAGILASLQNDSTVYNRLSDSADAQIASADFARDVQSASQLTTAASGTCGTARTFSDATLTSNSTSLISTSGQAQFTQADVGKSVADTVGAGVGVIPTMPATTIVAVLTPKAATLSAPATGSATGDTVTIRQGTPLLTLKWGQTISRTITDGVLQNNSTLQSQTAVFTTADVGSSVSDPTSIGGAGNVNTTISGLNSVTSVSLPVPGGIASGDHVMISRTVGSLVTYWADPVGLNTHRTYDLVRERCKTTPTATFPPTSATLAHDLAGNQGTATVACGPSIPPNTCTPGYLSKNWLYLIPPSFAANPNDGVMSVNLAITEPLSGFLFNLLATPRYSNPGGQGVASGGSPVPSVLLLGSGTKVLSAFNSTISVTGQIAFNSYNSDDVDLSGSATLSDSNPQNVANPFSVYQCGSPCSVINNPASYSGSAPANSASLVATPSVPAPNGPAQTDPAGTCSPSAPFSKGATVVCTPGVYASGVTVTKQNVKVSFSPGNYLFEGPVQETGTGDTFSFGAGVYHFSPSAGLPALSMSGTNDNLNGNGVSFYVDGGQVSLLGAKNSIQLSPATSGPYAGILLYQTPADTSGLQLSASANAIDNLTGAIEVPTGAVSIVANNNNAINLGFVVAKSVSALSLGAVNIIGR